MNKDVCSFCEKHALEVLRLFAAPGERAYICNECVLLCVQFSMVPPAVAIKAVPHE